MLRGIYCYERHFVLNLIGLSSFSCQYMRKALECSDKTKEHMNSLVVVPKKVLSEGLKKKLLPLD